MPNAACAARCPGAYTTAAPCARGSHHVLRGSEPGPCPALHASREGVGRDAKRGLQEGEACLARQATECSRGSALCRQPGTRRHAGDGKANRAPPPEASRRWPSITWCLAGTWYWPPNRSASREAPAHPPHTSEPPDARPGGQAGAGACACVRLLVCPCAAAGISRLSGTTPCEREHRHRARADTLTGCVWRLAALSRARYIAWYIRCGASSRASISCRRTAHSSAAQAGRLSIGSR